jgi:hypothetical protein
MTSTQRVAQVDVVQQQNAAAFGVKPLYGALHDLLRSDSPEPIVGNDVRAPGNQRL